VSLKLLAEGGGGDEISFMSDGSAFQARGPATEKACQLHEAEYMK